MLLGDVKTTKVSCEEIDDTQAKKEIAERMRQRLVALTQEHDKKYMIDIRLTLSKLYIVVTLYLVIMINFLMPIAISIINKAVDRIPEDLDSVIKDFVIKLLKKAASQDRK